MCESARQEQRLFRSDSQPARTLQSTECRKIEGGATIHDIALYVLKSRFAAFLRIPYQPKLSASYAMIAYIWVIAMGVGKCALRAHDKCHHFLIGHWAAAVGEEIKFAQRSQVERVFQPGLPEV